MAALYALLASLLFAAALVTTQFGLRHMDGLAGAKVSIPTATYPMFSLILNALILREEKPSLRLIAGVALMVGGVTVLSIK